MSERLVGSPAFKAGGMGDPCPAGSIPVHLRQPPFPAPALTRKWCSTAWSNHDLVMSDDEASGLRPLFTGAPMHDYFPIMMKAEPSVRMDAAPEPHTFPVGEPFDLPQTMFFNDTEQSVEDCLVNTDTVAIVVLQDGKVRHEQYRLTGGPGVHWISWSVAKSFISTLIGIAVEEGRIASITDAISDYHPKLVGSAYEGVSIEDVLQMSSGARWNEDYADPESDIHRFGAAMTGELTLDDFVHGMENEHPPGSLCRYNSADTQALGMMLAGAVSRPVAEYMKDKLIDPLGFEAEGYWITDTAGVEMTAGGLMLTPHDFAKLGELFRRGGDWMGEQIVSTDWVAAATRANKPHTQPGKPVIAGGNLPTGYGYQWWLPPGDRGNFQAIGIYNQYIHVDPMTESVIVKLSANRTYGTATSEEADMEGANDAFFSAVVAALD